VTLQFIKREALCHGRSKRRLYDYLTVSGTNSLIIFLSGREWT
jgi:hypothetical protein